MICELGVKCATLVAVIHALRLIGRRAGPRASGLILGLPSTTAVLLVLRAREEGTIAAVEMAEASLLGLVAAVALPIAYAKAVRRGWNLPAALAAAVAGYVVVASAMGQFQPAGFGDRLVIAFGSIVVASIVAARVGVPAGAPRRPQPSTRWAAVVRTIIPTSYVLIIGLATGVASPRWAGLIGTFPGMSTVVLAVTHLEDGAAPAGRIARALPPANLSTAAFLTAFRLGSPTLGIGWGLFLGFLAALVNLVAIGGIPRLIRLRRRIGWAIRPDRPPAGIGRPAWRELGSRPRILVRPTPRHSVRIGPPHRRHFAPRLEMWPC